MLKLRMLGLHGLQLNGDFFAQYSIDGVTSVDPITLDTGTELVAAALKPRRGVEWY